VTFARIVLPTVLLTGFLAADAFGASNKEYHAGLDCQAHSVRPYSGPRAPFTVTLRLAQTIPASCPSCESYDIFDAAFDSGAPSPASLGYFRRDWLYLLNAGDPAESYANETCSAILGDGADVHLSMGTGDAGVLFCLSCSFAP
jgi:hypothetical protein